MTLTAEDEAEVVPSGGSRLVGRVGWALTYLTKAGLVIFPKRGQACITDLGREFLTNHIGPIGISDLLQFPTFLEFQTSKSEHDDDAETGFGPVNSEINGGLDPDAQIEQALAQIKSAKASELLENLFACSPIFFEKMILDLMLAMNYGRGQYSLEHTGKSGDFGIDGIVSLDKLGFEKIYLQAKRWKSATVGGREIRDFYGALAYRKALRGVLITTSSFSVDAQKFAESLPNIILIDGKRLTALMIEHRVGIIETNLALPKIDTEYFEEEILQEESEEDETDNVSEKILATPDHNKY